MAIKDDAKHVIDGLPPKASMDDIMYALYVHDKFRRGEREIRKGRGVTHEVARKRLQKWVK
jgi:hypothetical protein